VKLPNFWAHATAEENDAQGNPVSFSCWRSSDSSEGEAHASALEAAKRVVRKLLLREPLQQYGYNTGALREQVIERLNDGTGELIGAVTQNGYGSLVLITAHVMFVDVDFPPVAAGEGLRHTFKSLFKRTTPSPVAQREEAARQQVERFLNDNPRWGVRLYRTAAGMRVLATHDLFDPRTDATRSVFEALGADPLYVRLCQAQECFRARLTPKPWRCGYYANRVAWPRENADAQNRFDQWNSEYNTRQTRYATCRFLASLGSSAVHPEAGRIVELHDHMTRSDQPLELA
jgi:hypothetical protein